MFLLDKETDLDLARLGKIIQIFQTRDLPKLNKYWNYYKGKQKIMGKVATDVGKPCNKVMTNYCYNIVNNYNGYLTGKDIVYNSENNFEPIQEALDYNDVHTEDNEFLKYALIFGIAYELNYIDEYGKNRFKVIDPRTLIPVYDDTLDQNLMYAIRFYKNDMVDGDVYMVEVYSKSKVTVYKSTMGFSSFTYVKENPLYFGMVPVTVFHLNNEDESIFAQVMTLQDAYNELLSDEVDDFQSFADAYLILKGVHAEAEDLVNMKENRVLEMDADADAGYLTKNITDTQIENMLKNINDTIHKIANSPDFSQESFGTSSGIALRYRLLGFENNSASIEANMTKALQKRLEIICNILNLKGGDSAWRDVKIQFTRNLPINMEEIAQMVNSLRGLVSDKTLLTIIPFIKDPVVELAQLEEERKANMAMYSFPLNNKDEDEDDLNE